MKIQRLMLRSRPEVKGKVDETLSAWPGLCEALLETSTCHIDERLGEATPPCEISGMCISVPGNFPGCCLAAHLCPTLETRWTVAHQASLSMGFPRQEYCSGLPFPSPGDRSNLGIKPGSPALQADSSILYLLLHNILVRMKRREWKYQACKRCSRNISIFIPLSK